MESLISSILIGISNFPFFAILFTVPILAFHFAYYKKFNIVRIGLDYAFLLYSLCFLAVVFLPLPSISQASKLSGHTIQYIPFHFIADIVKESPLRITNIHTYIPALTNRAVLQVVFNIVLTIPFGMFLRFNYHMSFKRIIAYSFALSLFVEVMQLTGLCFIYKGSYRLCDIDDLMANTLGGYFGYRIMGMVEKHVPAIEFFDITITSRKRRYL